MSLHSSLSQLLRTPLAGPIFKLYIRRRSWPQKGASPQTRVLLVNLMPALGDTVCYMAALEVLRHSRPDAHITWLADSAVAPLIAKHSAVDHVLSVTTPSSWALRVPTLKTYYRLLTIVRSIHKFPLADRFDVAIVLRGGADPSFSAHAIWLLNLPRSVGYSHHVESTESWHNLGEPLLTQVETGLRHPHEAARPIALLAAAGLAPQGLQPFNLDAALPGLQAIAELTPLATMLNKIGASSTPFVAIAPGASVLNRAWPVSFFHQLCQRILAQTNLGIILIGSPAERALCQRVAEGSPQTRVSNAAGKLNLPELVALISHARACVGNDSGPGHVAGALGIPTVSIHTQPKGSDPSHPRSPSKGRPLGPRVTVLQPDSFLPPCNECCQAKAPHCISQISVDTVWQALLNSLQIADSR